MEVNFEISYPYITQSDNNWVYENANQAFSILTNRIAGCGGMPGNNTIRLQNVGFYMAYPEQNHITEEWRHWNAKYAEREWNWYLSHSRDVSELQKHAPVWKRMHGGDCQVNSNYGWLWNRNKQLQKVIEKLEDNPDTRQAWLTLYDGKEMDDYYYDTPCTLNIGFKVDIYDNYRRVLNMTVLMRSNDLIFGFCNDQYCFSQLQKYVASRIGATVGDYYHFAQDLHIYLPSTNVYPKHINDYLKNVLKL
jgi:thymidylate synthase